MKRGVMIDIETMATVPNALILSIGACRFDIDKGIYDKKYIVLNAHTARDYCLTVDPKTIDWWKKQSPEARAVLSGGIDYKTGIEEFYDYIRPNEVCMAWGSVFDFPILENSFRKIGKTIFPWVYPNVLCARSVARVFDLKLEKSGVNHNALDDAVATAELMLSIYKD